MKYGDNNRLYFNRNRQLWTPIFIETVSMSRPHGKIIIANKANENSMFPVYGMMELLGCTEGRRRNGLTCDICPKEPIQILLVVILVIYVIMVILHFQPSQ